ncbi:flagellar type III secretion system pore protein FliP [Paracoccaceae bacterium GXU_MW_L88]
MSPKLFNILLGALFFASPALAQEVSISAGGGSLTMGAVQLFGIITVLSLAPGIAIMVTCFPFMVTVLSILRQALGVQQAPPNMLIVSLALFLTWFVMAPVFTEAWEMGISPLLNEQIETEQAINKTLAPFEIFMAARVDTETLDNLFESIPEGRNREDLSVLIPAFMLSEIQRGFEVGFLIFLPFLVIDLVVAAVLMSMGMMMVPPAMVALPFKLAFFVISDGWSLLAGALVRSYQ